MDSSSVSVGGAPGICDAIVSRQEANDPGAVQACDCLTRPLAEATVGIEQDGESNGLCLGHYWILLGIKYPPCGAAVKQALGRIATGPLRGRRGALSSVR